MKVVFGNRLDSAVLLAPPTQFNGAVCLQFQYRLSHRQIILSIHTTNLSNFSPTTKTKLNYWLQVSESDWNAANVTLENPDNQVQQVAFVAEQIGFTKKPEYAAIRNIVVTNSPCPPPGDHTLQNVASSDFRLSYSVTLSSNKSRICESNTT